MALSGHWKKFVDPAKFDPYVSVDSLGKIKVLELLGSGGFPLVVGGKVVLT
jgi:hypothetical protein